MKILKRKHARIARVLTLLALVLLVLLAVTTQMHMSDAVVRGVALAFVLLMAGASVVVGKTLKCPNCGKGKAMATWNPGKQPQVCRKCGKPLLFDDEVKAEDAAQQ